MNNEVTILLVIVVMITSTLKRGNTNLSEEISREFKNIKPPTFNGETEKGEEAES